MTDWGWGVCTVDFTMTSLSNGLGYTPLTVLRAVAGAELSGVVVLENKPRVSDAHHGDGRDTRQENAGV